jgi:hypothetical protein
MKTYASDFTATGTGALQHFVLKVLMKMEVFRAVNEWQNNIKMFLREIGCYAVHCSKQNKGWKVVRFCEQGNETSGSIKPMSLLKG